MPLIVKFTLGVLLILIPLVFMKVWEFFKDATKAMVDKLRGND